MGTESTARDGFLQGFMGTPDGNEIAVLFPADRGVGSNPAVGTENTPIRMERAVGTILLKGET